MKCSSSSVLTLSAIAGLALASQAAFAGSIFSDNFSTSTLNSLTPSAPTATSTAYQYLSGKSPNPDPPTIASGALTFGISSTSSGATEVQALFPSYSMNVGDVLTLTVVFTDTSGILTGNGLLGIGMYNSGGVAPIAGGLANAATSGNDLGSLQGTAEWQGYVGQFGYTGLQNNRIMDRQAQTGTTANDQDLVASGSSSQSYHDPSGSTVGGSSVASLLSLTAGQQFTDVLTYTLTASGMQIDNNIYNNRNANLASTTATGVTPLTTTFDGLAVGWIERGSEATTMEINSINIDATAVPEPVSMAFLGMGALGMILGLRRNRR